jgi:hypothetical protein
LFIAVLAKGFSFVGHRLRENEAGNQGIENSFIMWALGASLFSHAVTLISVSYFDQSLLFLYLTLAAICSNSPSNAAFNVTPVANTPPDAPSSSSKDLFEY